MSHHRFCLWLVVKVLQVKELNHWTHCLPLGCRNFEYKINSNFSSWDIHMVMSEAAELSTVKHPAGPGSFLVWGGFGIRSGCCRHTHPGADLRLRIVGLHILPWPGNGLEIPYNHPPTPPILCPPPGRAWESGWEEEGLFLGMSWLSCCWPNLGEHKCPDEGLEGILMFTARPFRPVRSGALLIGEPREVFLNHGQNLHA